MFNERVCAVLDYTNLVLLDIKALRPELCRKVSGSDGRNARALLDELEKRGTEVWIRHVVVPGLTDDDTLLDELVEFVRHYKVVRKIEWLPYHTMGGVQIRGTRVGLPVSRRASSCSGEGRSH